MQPPLIRLADVQKTFANGVVAVDSVSFELAEGEFVSLLGPSGCGKSTVLRLIAGLSRPTRGVLMRAWDHEPQGGGRQPISYVFQEPTLMPWASVWENAYLPLRIAGVRRADAHNDVDEALRLVGLAGVADLRPNQLSGGMKMRVSMARALVTTPRLILLDEPFAALDEITRQRLNDELLTLWRQRRPAVLFVTHSVLESVYLSNRVLVMSSRPGRIVEEIKVDLPPERSPDLRTTEAYNELCRRASAALERAMNSTES